jgi:glycosyltransferase involved in cell wall biosynthesis
MTIGITAYRESKWLRDCWNSVVAQTCQDWDAIIVLDGGVDSVTERIFDELSHPRLKKIKCLENNFCRSTGPCKPETVARC